MYMYKKLLHVNFAYINTKKTAEKRCMCVKNFMHTMYLNIVDLINSVNSKIHPFYDSVVFKGVTLF